MRVLNKLNFLIPLPLFFLPSCRKFVEIPIPKNQLITAAVFQDSAGANSAVVGIYISMMQSLELTMSSGGLTVYTGMTSDELYPTSTSSSSVKTDERNFYENAISPLSNINGNTLWARSYNLIYHVNSCIDGLSQSDGISETLRQRLLGECRLVRAFLYFNLLNLYGGVPLATSPDYHTNQKLARASSAQLYDQIISDLNYSQANLPKSYLTEDRLRPNSYTASSLLSKVYLFLGDWKNAEMYASKVINAGIYSLEVNLNNIFLTKSLEKIWGLEPVIPSVETTEAVQLIPTTATRKPNFVLTNSLMAAFESGDKRAQTGNWINSNLVAGIRYPYPYKYKQSYRPAAGSPVKEHYVVFRLAEQVLIRAEARAKQGDLVNAITDINLIRNRAGLKDLPLTLTKNEVVTAVEQERRVELFCEWGNRWFDLNRWQHSDAVLRPIKSDWQSTDKLFPIPQIEIDRNPSLIQNPGY